MKKQLPQFIVIGAVKAATTWIQAQLQANPAIFMPDPEPHFFSTGFDRGFAHYARFFEGAGDGQIVGEKSADYLAHERAAENIARYLPDIPMVVQLRNPVERAYSDYKMLYRRGTISGPPEDYLTRMDCDQPRCLADGLYARHLRRWMEYFDESQFRIILFEDVRQHPEATVKSVCDHIAAPYHFADTLAQKRVNDGGENFLPLSVRRALAPLKNSVAPLRGTKLFETVRGLIAKPVEYPPLSRDLRAHLMDFYARDVEDLGRITGRDLSHWVTRHRQAA